ncbi:hypothetical protein GCM10010446_52230 [Streptomyces enissocaesilis]|uniref:Uncharacterized protein n=1 Tax=Streptomyces enissocaesilis TaxID=332589 RepID=A0ABN3XJ77_9ACTN
MLDIAPMTVSGNGTMQPAATAMVQAGMVMPEIRHQEPFTRRAERRSAATGSPPGGRGLRDGAEPGPPRADAHGSSGGVGARHPGPVRLGVPVPVSVRA